MTIHKIGIIFFAVLFFKSSAQNIPLLEIIDSSYKGIKLNEAFLFFYLGENFKIIDTTNSPNDIFKIKFYKRREDFTNILSKERRMTVLSVYIMEIVSDTIKINLSISNWDNNHFDPKTMLLGEEVDSRDIECVYDKIKKKWVYSRTLEVRDF